MKWKMEKQPSFDYCCVCATNNLPVYSSDSFSRTTPPNGEKTGPTSTTTASRNTPSAEAGARQTAGPQRNLVQGLGGAVRSAGPPARSSCQQHPRHERQSREPRG